MNKVIENIHQRRSVRQFENKNIPEDILNSIIDAANAAPSAMNLQQWRFLVVRDESFRKRIAGIAYEKYKVWLNSASDDFKERRREIDAQVEDPIYYDAPVIIFVIGSGMTAHFDCPMVCQNIMLAARSYDIGSCWVYLGQMIFDDQDIRNIMELKETESVYGPIILGYPMGEFPEPPARKEHPVIWL